jgi:phosphoglycerate dehydrogenase-like enzyme
MAPAQVRAALRRNPAAAQRVRVTVGYDRENLERMLKTADGLVGWNFPRQDLRSRAPHLRWFHAIGAGVNHYFPLDWLPRNVVFTNNRGVHGERAAEYAITAVLMLNNRIPEIVTNQRAACWRQCFNTAAQGKTLLIVGVGHVGGAAARLAKFFDIYVIGVRRTGRKKRYVDEMHTPEALRRLIPRADFVLVTAPETTRSYEMIGKREIALMKRGAGLVSYSRAGLVDYQALRARLNKGELSAVLDVFDPEPLPSSSPLWRTRNLILTPHCSSDDPVSFVPRTLDLVLDNAARLAARKTMRNRVSRTRQY